MIAIPLPATLLGLSLIGFCLISFLRWFFTTRTLRVDAVDEFANRTRSGSSSIEGVGEDEFVSLYIKSYQPRWALYTSGALATVILASPVMLLASSAAYQEIWRFNGAPEWGGTIGYVYMFSIAFGVAFMSAVIVALFARYYHRRAPEPFHHALARARGEPIPEETTWRRRPKWAKHIKPPKPTSNAPSTDDR